MIVVVVFFYRRTSSIFNCLGAGAHICGITVKKYTIILTNQRSDTSRVTKQLLRMRKFTVNHLG